MAGILDILIEILKIDCSVAQCYYPNEIEAMFYLFFFPTVFIILFIYILTNFIFRGGGAVRGIRMLIAIGAYAFIVFEGLFTSVVAISHLWWLLTIILVGLFAFIRHLFTGGREGGGGHMPGVGREGAGIIERLKGEALEKFLKHTHLETRKEEIERISEEEVLRVKAKHDKSGWNSLTHDEKIIWLVSHGVSPKKKTDLDKLYDSLQKSSTLD